MPRGGGWNLVVGPRLDGVNKIREAYGILDEEDGDVVSNNVEVSLLLLVKEQDRGGLVGELGRFTSSVQKRTANPLTSLTLSLEPRGPATVLKRMKVGVTLPSSERKDAAVMLLKSP